MGWSSSNLPRILIVSDAWNEINGVVTTLVNLKKELEEREYAVKVLSCQDCGKTTRMPFNPEITLGWIDKTTIYYYIMAADAIHIATPEGPIGYAVMRTCVKRGLPFTTSYHPKWSEIVRSNLPLPKRITYKLMSLAHKNSKTILVPTKAVKRHLENHGFDNLKVWTRGVDRDVFKPNPDKTKSDLRNPVLLCVSRIEKNKGVEDFCQLNAIGFDKKIVVGDGPYLETLSRKYPLVDFVGAKTGEELAEYYRMADALIYTDKDDTFSNVIIEAMACGTPVASFPVKGFSDFIQEKVSGITTDDIAIAMFGCMTLDRQRVVEASMQYSWEECATQFLDALHFKSPDFYSSKRIK